MKRVKTILCALLFVFATGHFLAAADAEAIESLEVLGFLLGLSAPAPPAIIDNMVVFTASSSLRRVGIAFADEGFSQVHWFRPLMVSEDPLERIRRGRRESPYRDSGIAFHVREIPRGISQIEYRLVINGLWTTDPSNPNTRRDGVSGPTLSVLPIPQMPQQVHHTLRADGLHLVFTGPPGEMVTVAGSFNNWDPFMFVLREGPPGTYSIHIPLPPGRHQYVFFHRGERVLDPLNPVRVFSREGLVASEIVIY